MRLDPTKSLVYDRKADNEKHFLAGHENDAALEFTGLHKIVLALFGLTFGVMIWGVLYGGWWMGEMTGLFLASALLIGIIARTGEQNFVDAFLNGARDLLGVALIIGLARGIVVIMDAGNIIDTILHRAEVSVSGLSAVVLINVIYWFEVLLSFFVPSSSGLAVLSMPIMAPVADFVGTGRDLVVTAYQSANGLVNLVNPTFAVVMGALAIGRVRDFVIFCLRFQMLKRRARQQGGLHFGRKSTGCGSKDRQAKFGLLERHLSSRIQCVSFRKKTVNGRIGLTVLRF